MVPGFSSGSYRSLHLQQRHPLLTSICLFLSRQLLLSSVEQMESWLCTQEACPASEGLGVSADRGFTSAARAPQAPGAPHPPPHPSLKSSPIHVCRSCAPGARPHRECPGSLGGELHPLTHSCLLPTTSHLCPPRVPPPRFALPATVPTPVAGEPDSGQTSEKWRAGLTRADTVLLECRGGGVPVT